MISTNGPRELIYPSSSSASQMNVIPQQQTIPYNPSYSQNQGYGQIQGYGQNQGYGQRNYAYPSESHTQSNHVYDQRSFGYSTANRHDQYTQPYPQSQPRGFYQNY